MEKDHLITAIDIGSNQVICGTGKLLENGSVELLFASSKSLKNGLKAGIVTSIQFLSKAIKDCIEENEKELGIQISEIYAGIRGSHIESLNNHGVKTISRSDKEISEDDVYDVIDNAKAVHLQNDREIIHIIPQDFSVDKEKGFENPVGMEGNILETTVHIITANISHLNNISKTISHAGFSVKEFVYHSYPLAEVVLSDEEKNIGAAVVDIGDMVTSVVIYQDGKIKFSKDREIGSYLITKDIAYLLHTSYEEAKKIKENHLYAMHSVMENDEEIMVTVNNEKKKIMLSEIITYSKPRVEEIILTIGNIIKSAKIDINNIVLCGGGSMLKGFDKAFQKIFKDINVRYGYIPDDIVKIKDKKYTNQKYITAISLLAYPTIIKPRIEMFSEIETKSNFFSFSKKILDFIKNIFS
jgi:cell division protein FtsA